MNLAVFGKYLSNKSSNWYNSTCYIFSNQLRTTSQNGSQGHQLPYMVIFPSKNWKQKRTILQLKSCQTDVSLQRYLQNTAKFIDYITPDHSIIANQPDSESAQNCAPDSTWTISFEAHWSEQTSTNNKHILHRVYGSTMYQVKLLS